jgi:hypothetical protein
VIVVWHLFVLAKIPAGLTGQQVLSAAIAINVVPLVGLFLLWTHYPGLASEHFLSNGPDYVFRMSATEWSLPFTISAVLLTVLELCGCWLCIRMFGISGQVSFRISKN